MVDGGSNFARIQHVTRSLKSSRRENITYFAPFLPLNVLEFHVFDRKLTPGALSDRHFFTSHLANRTVSLRLS